MAEMLTAQRELGRTGVRVPLIGYGTAAVGKDKVGEKDAVRCLNHAIDRGITYLDTSPDYGSEEFVGEVMKTRRGEVFLATKVNKRSRDGALEELKQSLKKLQTDHVDLIQIHAVNAWADLEQVQAPDGVLQGMQEARRQGLCRFIGITGHARPEILGCAVSQFSFDTVLVALGVVDRLVTSPETFLLPKARERGMGVIAMKVLGHGHVKSKERALRYSLGLDGVSLAIIGMKSEAEIDENVGFARAFRPLEEREEEQLIEEVRPLVERDASESKMGQGSLFWLHDTTVMGWAQHDEPVLVEY